MAAPQLRAGSLTVVGTGIRFGAHLTAEARVELERADIVLCLVAEPVARAWLERLNPRAQSLHTLYEPGRPRNEVYAVISDEILRRVREGLDVCVAVYGHPGLFASPSHNALARARDEGFRTRLLPGISAEDCLFADLGIDPAWSGWQSYEATAFLENGRRPDPHAALILWQIGVVGNGLAGRDVNPVALSRLVEALLEVYPGDHEVVVYESAPYPGFDSLIRRVPLGVLSAEHLTGLSTLYVPPRPSPQADRQ